MLAHHAEMTRARSKIVATVGPSCNSSEKLSKLLDVSVDVF